LGYRALSAGRGFHTRQCSAELDLLLRSDRRSRCITRDALGVAQCTLAEPLTA